jgi:hypothetical protein
MDTNHQLSARVVPFVRLAQLGAGQNVPDKWEAMALELSCLDDALCGAQLQ